MLQIHVHPSRVHDAIRVLPAHGPWAVVTHDEWADRDAWVTVHKSGSEFVWVGDMRRVRVAAAGVM